MIGPFMPFIAIVGPNGAGKSNIMDAISFVIGEKNKALRSFRAHVTAFFEIEGKSKKFTRCIHNSCSEFKIDNQIVSSELYIHELASLGLNTKTKSFLVFQGTIESMCMASPTEISLMFDELSKSAELKLEYKKYKREMQQINVELHYMVQKKKYILAEKKRLILQREEAGEYTLLQKEYLDTKTELQLFKLLHIKKVLKKLKILWTDIKSKIDEYNDDEKKVEIVLQRNKNRYAELTDHVTTIENNLTAMEQKLARENEQLLNAKEKACYLQKKILHLRTSLTKVRHANETHKRTIRDLQDELAKMEQLKIGLTQSISSQLESQGSNIELDNAQVKEYCLLKGRVQRECAEYTKHLNCLKREQENDQYKLDNEKRKKQEMDDKKNRELQFRINQMENKIKSLEQYIMTTEITLTEQQKFKHILESGITQNRIIIEETQEELDRITKELNAFKVDKFAISRENKKLEINNILKSLFPEVYGRLSTLCEPVHERYNIALTKVLWKYKDAIIVKTEKVAKQCISYLKEQQISVETFLPLDSLKVKPLSKNLQHILRDMKDSKNVQLLYNIIKFLPQDISNAVLFATNNIILCETPEDAQRIAYESHLVDRYTCISLDGSFYQKSGIISGGFLELSTKAAVWQNKNIQKLKLQKVALMRKLKDASQYTTKESELNTVNYEILSLTSRLKYSRTDIENIKKQLIDFKMNSESVDQQLTLISCNIESIEKAMHRRYKKIETVENEIFKVEDTIFTDFCRNIDVNNIREYERGKLRIRKEQKKRATELENQYDCIKNTLDLEIRRNTEDKVMQYETAIQSTEEQLKLTLLEESAIASNIEKQSIEFDNLKSVHSNMDIEVVEAKNEVAQCRHQIGIIAKLILEAKREYTMIVMKIKQKITELNSIIKNFKMEGLTIPMLDQNTSYSSTCISSSLSSNASEQGDGGILAKIDFSYLPQELQTSGDEEFEDIKNKLSENVKILENKLKFISAPNLKAKENMAIINVKLNTLNKALKEIRDNALIAKEKFTRIIFTKYEAAPFIVLDEIDAALDKINVENIVSFIQFNANLMHFIIISLKKELFVNADGLLGVSSRQEEDFLESKIFTLSLKSYKTKKEDMRDQLNK
ncbi:hypothetical protein KPH14_002655 [Odynerus spinipes]|uniref:SMC hinge domain-containing protein n=1 Tax=Odynerus spinipes TaxID=1348599 RepID=A0AAD9RGX3_9HYME|nr:hypothetical protein KPH14_002655 [Odynerus spinipes]